MWRSMSAPASMRAIGFTLFCPAYFGAEPWIASKTATPFSPMFAPGATPSPPTKPAARSLTMSPYRFGSTITSYSSGFWTSCMHMLSTMRSSKSTRPSNAAATVRHESRNRPSDSCMLLAVWSGVALRSITASPASTTSHSKPAPDASRTRLVASASSGPMPSPGIRVTGWAMGSILIQRDAVTGLRGPRRTLCHSREMPVDPRSRIVAAGFDAIVDRHLAWSAAIEGDPRADWLERFGALVARGGVVVELGCGAAPPSTRWLADRYRLTGVDLSRGQLERARP